MTVSKIQIRQFDEIFDQAAQAKYFDYASKKIQHVNCLERVVRLILSAVGLMESTISKCIRVSSESLLQALRTPRDPFVTNELRVTVDLLEQSDPKVAELAKKINKLAPKLLQQCYKAYQQAKAEIAKGSAASTDDDLPTVQELRQRETEVKKREDDVEIRENEVEKRDAELDLREEAVTKREDDVLVREDEVGKRETAVTNREAQATLKEAANTKKETELKTFEAELNKREAALNALAARLKYLSDMENDPRFAAFAKTMGLSQEAQKIASPSSKPLNKKGVSFSPPVKMDLQSPGASMSPQPYGAAPMSLNSSPGSVVSMSPRFSPDRGPQIIAAQG